MNYSRPSRPQAQGFARVITVSALMLVAVGLPNLSTATVRGAGLPTAKAETRANTQLALRLAT